MQIEKVNINKIKPYKNNAKIHTQKQIEQVIDSIEEFGFNDPIAIDENNVIIEGHGRWEALKLLLPTHSEFKTVDCIRLCHLNDEQKRAYIHAHNQLTLNTGFDKGLLDLELESIVNIDMTKLGFELPQPFTAPDENEDEDKDFHRENTYRAYNLELVDLDRVAGKYQMPILEKCTYIPNDLIGFNYMMSSKNKNAGIHCFVDDYQFERLWNNPYKYIDKILEYDAFLTPDFSLYMDMPMAMKIWNVFRSRLIGQFLQNAGMEVIPTISWAEPETFCFCFDGIEQGSVVAVSTIGVKNDKDALKIWTDGMDAMIAKIKPAAILVYGGKLEHDYKGIPVHYYENKVTERMKATKLKSLQMDNI